MLRPPQRFPAEAATEEPHALFVVFDEAMQRQMDERCFRSVNLAPKLRGAFVPTVRKRVRERLCQRSVSSDAAAVRAVCAAFVDESARAAEDVVSVARRLGAARNQNAADACFVCGDVPADVVAPCCGATLCAACASQLVAYDDRCQCGRAPSASAAWGALLAASPRAGEPGRSWYGPDDDGSESERKCDQIP